MKKGIQLYAIKALASTDMEKGLKTVAELGYDGVEFAGFFDHSAEQVKAWLDTYHLEALGAHIQHADIFEHVDETIAFHKAIGNTRIICPYYPMETRDDVMELVAKINAVEDKYKAAGMKIYYHNHAHEFKKDGEDYLIDILADAVSKDILSLEFDVYWVYRGGECPVKYLKKYADRIDTFHAKDGIGEDATVLGEGAVDMEAVFAFAKENNMAWAVCECEGEEDIESQVAAVTKDAAALKKFM